MEISAFGVEHWESTEVFKRSKESKQRSEHYGRMSNTMAAMGGTTAAVGTGSGIVGALERKGKDPMGFVSVKAKANEAKVKPAVRTRVLNANARAHFTQAKVAGGLTAASLGLAGAYKHAKKKEMAKRLDKDAVKYGAIGTGAALAGGAAAVGGVAAHNKSKGRKWNDGGPRRKAGTFWEGSPLDKNKVKKALKPETKRKARDAAADTATVGVGGAAIAGGAKMVGALAPATKAHAPNAWASHQVLRGEKAGNFKLGPKQKAMYLNNRRVSGRVAAVKGAGTLASAGIMGMGGKAIYDTGKNNAKKIKDN